MSRTFPIEDSDGIIQGPTHDQQIAVINTLIHHNALDVAAMILAPPNPTKNRNRKWKAAS
jgi:hypothetical protein